MPPAALGSTGNAALSPGCLAVAAAIEGLTSKFDIGVVQPDVSDTLGDTALADYLASDSPNVTNILIKVFSDSSGQQRGSRARAGRFRVCDVLHGVRVGEVSIE
jgi:hypothetical protein